MSESGTFDLTRSGTIVRYGAYTGTGAAVAKKPTNPNLPIGETLRRRRVETLGKSVRDMAKLLDTSPIHISDIETGKRVPSDDLLVRMAHGYGLAESELRAGFARPDAVVGEVATESATAAEKVPEFLRTARGLSAEQWDKLIKQAKKLTGENDA